MVKARHPAPRGFTAADKIITGAWTFSGVTTFTGNIVAGTIDADFDAITGTSYGGILEANLLDKTDTETISGVYTFTADDGLIITNNSPEIHLREEDATTDEGNWIIRATGDGLKFQTASDAAPTTGAESFWTCLRTGTVADEVRIKAALLSVRGGASFDILDSTNADKVSMNHDGTHFNIAATQTDDINVTGYDGTWRFPTGKDITFDGANGRFQVQATGIVNDDATVTFAGAQTISRGMWFVMDDGNQDVRFAMVVIDEGTTMTVLHVGSSAAAATANPNTDGKMNVFISGGGLAIKNRLGINTSFTLWQFGL